ncbi:MAG TPA: SRPBCC family protein [Propionibacteriaceae bacterium]|nr:SRPBCC family protein [Propionibacteriaceae bacterium]
MGRISGEILIKRQVEQVFDYVADQRNEPIYNPRMLHSEKITDGPVGVGTRFRVTAQSGWREIEMLIEVTDSSGLAGLARGPRCPLPILMAD